MKKQKVIFIKSPTGKFGLAYAIGETGEFETDFAQELISEGYAITEAQAKKEAALLKESKENSKAKGTKENAKGKGGK